MDKRSKGIKLLSCVFLLLFCSFISGCATIGGASSGFAGALSSILMLPFKALGGILDIVSKLPKPPPGVIPGVF